MANGHSAEAIEATTERDPFSDDIRGPDMVDKTYPRVPLSRADWNQQEETEKQRQETEWQKNDDPEVLNLKPSRSEFLNDLVRLSGLTKEEDIFALPVGGRTVNIITRTGIEKIQYQNRIRVNFKECILEKDFAVIKAVATMEGKHETVKVETYGSALFGKKPTGNTNFTYICEMAEKRALARAVLKLCGAYRYGVYAEDESEDFRKKR
jgi:hypothetical protein